MKILQVAPRYPPHTGGVETHVREISERLVDRGHEVTVVTADAGEDVQAVDTCNGVDIRRYKGFSPGGAFHVAPSIVRAVRRANVDVVHAHNYHSLPLFFAALGVSEERFVVTPHYHGGSASRWRDKLLSVYRPIGDRALRQADRMIAVSEWERDQLQRDFGVEAKVIPNGLDADRFATATPEERERPYLLYVGRLAEYKGIQHVIRALSDLPSHDFLIIGEGNFRDELERTAKEAGATDRVEFLGYVDSDRLPELYAGADVFVTLSAFESYGLTVAEALAAGTPCVVRRARALEDWCDTDGVACVDAVNPKAVAATIDNASNQTARAATVTTWEAVCDSIEEEYRDLVRLTRHGTRYDGVSNGNTDDHSQIEGDSTGE